ncbi:ATP-binding cassette domain-containing protein [Streptococcus merionis]|uniref:ATP-binding cassette domain-containing protein n=1 Tax=Streptococcus merionis TaxID=400065 RepID=UPI003514BD0C
MTDEFDAILDYQIVNNGENISGGQRAHLEIARSLIRQKDVLLADEVTAPLDAKNAKVIRNLLFNLPVTIIEIAHHTDDEFIYDGVIDLSQTNNRIKVIMHAILQKKPEIKKISQDKNQGVGLNRN